MDYCGRGETDYEESNNAIGAGLLWWGFIENREMVIMADGKTNWKHYSRDELIQIIEYIESMAGDDIIPMIKDAKKQVKAERYLILCDVVDRLQEEIRAATEIICELLDFKDKDQETADEIQRLSYDAMRNIYAREKALRQIDRILKSK